MANVAVSAQKKQAKADKLFKRAEKKIEQQKQAIRYLEEQIAESTQRLPSFPSDEEYGLHKANVNSWIAEISERRNKIKALLKPGIDVLDTMSADERAIIREMKTS